MTWCSITFLSSSAFSLFHSILTTLISFCFLNTPDILSSVFELSYVLFFLPRIQFPPNSLSWFFQIANSHVTLSERLSLNTVYEIIASLLSHLLAMLIIWLLKIILLFLFLHSTSQHLIYQIFYFIYFTFPTRI